MCPTVFGTGRLAQAYPYGPVTSVLIKRIMRVWRRPKPTARKSVDVRDLWGLDYWGAPSSTGTPPTLPSQYFQVLPAAQSRMETHGTGAPGQAESKGVRQVLVGTSRRREVSEGFLPPTGQAPPSPSRSRGATREDDITSAQDRAW